MPEWTVGADRDLPIVSGDWDGDAAAASVFAWAGFDGDSPDASKARRAFLIYDASEPTLRGSYKLPIARHRDGRLEVVDSGLRAAASYLPQTDAPKDVLERARAVLDHYFNRLEASRDSASRNERHPKMTTPTKHTVEVGLALGRDSVDILHKAGIRLPKPLRLTVDEVDANMIREKLGELSESAGEMAAKIAELMQVVAGAEAKMAEQADEYAGKMKDMMNKEQVQAEIAKHEEQIAALKESLMAATDARNELTKERDALLAEVEPLRAEQLSRLRDQAVKLGAAKDKVDATKDAQAIRRLAVQAHARDNADKWSAAQASDDKVAGRFDALVELFVNEPEVPAPARDERDDSALASLPTPQPHRNRDKQDDDKPRPRTALSGLALLNGG